MKIAMSCSMKFKDKINRVKIKLEKLGHEVLFPNLDYSEDNSKKTKLELAKDHYKAIEEADVIYFLLPNGYIGTSCKLELGYAIALKKDIFFSENTKDNALDCYPKAIISIKELKEFNNIKK